SFQSILVVAITNTSTDFSSILVPAVKRETTSQPKHALLLLLDEYPLRSLLHPTRDIAHWPQLSRRMWQNHHRLPFHLCFTHRAARRTLHNLNRRFLPAKGFKLDWS